MDSVLAEKGLAGPLLQGLGSEYELRTPSSTLYSRVTSGLSNLRVPHLHHEDDGRSPSWCVGGDTC